MPLMHLSLSDLVTCPRCGPSHGLVLLPTEVRDRRVESGALGCPNCRERFAITAGVADLRGPGSGGSGAPGAAGAVEPETGSESDEASVLRLAALLGLAEPRGPVALAGPAVAAAGGLAALLDGVAVVALSSGEEVVGSGGAPVSWIRSSGPVPFRDGVFGAVALTGPRAELVAEGLRVLRPGGRLLLEPANESVRSAALAAGGIQVLREGPTLVVARGA
jgi:uncharacterized protein YbaR (Trm112 family)